jgi:outer membrane protein insertion porin family
MKAQDRGAFDQGKNTLADVKLTNKISFNDQTVVTFAGLEKAKNHHSRRRTAAIKKLKPGFDEISFT